MSMKHCTYLSSAIAVAAVGSSDAAILIDPGAVVGGSITPAGTLVVIDVPTPTAFPATGGGDSDWLSDANVIATQADQGFQVLGGSGIQSENYGNSTWEPDGTPAGEGKNFAGYSGTLVAFNFNLTNSGIDIPDGSVINGIYTTWRTRRVDNSDYFYTEGAASDTVNIQFGTAPTADLVIRWVDGGGGNNDGNFQQILSGPIVVEGGDGFQLRQDRNPNTAHLDAVIIDVTLPGIPEPSSLALLGLGGLLVARRRRG